MTLHFCCLGGGRARLVKDIQLSLCSCPTELLIPSRLPRWKNPKCVREMSLFPQKLSFLGVFFCHFYFMFLPPAASSRQLTKSPPRAFEALKRLQRRPLASVPASALLVFGRSSLLTATSATSRVLADVMKTRCSGAKPIWSTARQLFVKQTPSVLMRKVSMTSRCISTFHLQNFFPFLLFLIPFLFCSSSSKNVEKKQKRLHGRRSVWAKEMKEKAAKIGTLPFL